LRFEGELEGIRPLAILCRVFLFLRWLCGDRPAELAQKATELPAHTSIPKQSVCEREQRRLIERSKGGGPEMARRGEDYARLNPGGGYTQALAVGKGFSGAERRAARQGGSSGSSSGGRGGGGTMNAFARHQEIIRNYHRYAECYPGKIVDRG